MPLVAHDHIPIYRVIRAGWADALDASFSADRSNRWNRAGGTAVLYTCCSETVAVAIVRDIFKIASLHIEDLLPEARPTLAEITWAGNAVDMASAEGILECGFPLSYPAGVSHEMTQPFAEAWWDLGAEAVMCRSASVWRTAHEGWMGSHEPWSELAICVGRAKLPPRLIRRRRMDDWLPSDD